MKDKNRLKIKRQRKTCLPNSNRKKAGVPIVTLDKSDAITKVVTVGKERHFIMIKGPNHQEDITIY